MTLDEFRRLLERPEGETLDFKQVDYDFAKADQQNEFAKDILSMANTPRDGDAHIVLGVRWNPGEGSTIVGLMSQRDDAIYQDAVCDKRVSPRPQFQYTPLAIEDRQVGVITIPRHGGGPFTATGDFPGLQAGTIYYRRGTTNARAVGDDLRRIMIWFADGSRDVLGQSPPPAW